MGGLNWWFPQVGGLTFPVWKPSVLPRARSDINQALGEPDRQTRAPLLSAQQNPSLQVLVERVLIQLFAQVLERPEACIKGTSHCFESGGDTPTLSALLRAIEERLQVRLGPEEIIERPILFRLAAVVTQRQATMAQLSIQQQGGMR